MKFSGRNVHVGENVRIGAGVRIGDDTTIYDNVILEENVVIANNCVIGEPTSAYYTSPDYVNQQTVIGANSLIRSHTIIYAGSRFGNGFSTGHRVTIRENTLMGEGCRVGTLSDIQGNVEFGQHCWLHSNVHIAQQSRIGNYVFIYPYAIFTNDPHPPSNVIIGPTVGDFTQIAVGSILLPGVNVGRHCLLAANSVITKNVNDFSLMAGNPALFVKDVREIVSRETGKPHYPWPDYFSRGLPWEQVGFDNWQKAQ